ncbi:MAG: PaaI family thioesterase [Tepidiformaceae bacterium]
MFDPEAERSKPDWWLKRQEGRLPGLIGVTPTGFGRGWAEARLEIRPELWAPNGFLHAATVIALADTLCGYGCVANLPEGASGFTTVEVKSNFLGTATEGSLTARATLVHGGRTTQVWDAPVVHEQTGKTIALFRCTQMVLWPK